MPEPTTPPSITAVPTPQPVRSDRSTFSARVDAFVTWLPTHITDLIAALANCYNNAVSAYNDAVAALASQIAATTSATNASYSAAAAAASAASAAASPGTSATSTTSLAIGLGSKSLTIQTGKSLVVGAAVNIAYTTDPTQYMHGLITAYDSGAGALTVDVTKKVGSATWAVWTVSLVGPAGTDGVNGRDCIIGAGTLIASITYDADSTAGSFTVNMPDTPANGDTVTLIDPLGTWAENPVTLARNGSNFVDQYGTGQAEDYILNLNNMQVTFIYTASGWRAI